jgi:hypothetical protein
MVKGILLWIAACLVLLLGIWTLRALGWYSVLLWIAGGLFLALGVLILGAFGYVCWFVLQVLWAVSTLFFVQNPDALKFFRRCFLVLLAVFVVVFLICVIAGLSMEV